MEEHYIENSQKNSGTFRETWERRDYVMEQWLDFVAVHCSQSGLPERENIAFVVTALKSKYV